MELSALARILLSVMRLSASFMRSVPKSDFSSPATAWSWARSLPTGHTASQAGHSSQSGGALAGWKFANVKDGVFAEYFHVNEADANMALIPPDVSEEKAVYCCDMMSTGFMAAENAEIPIGGTVAVFALGPVGLMAVAGARLRGASLVIGIDSILKRQELARVYGADAIVDHTREDAVARIMKLTNGLGVDSAIEALGSEQTLQNAIKVTKPGGTISNAGYHGKGEYVSIPRLDWAWAWRRKPSAQVCVPVDGCEWSGLSECFKRRALILH